MRLHPLLALIPICALAGNMTNARPTPQPSAFVYQGHLTFNNQPATDTYDFECRLFDAAVGGNQVGGLITPGSIEADDQGNFVMTLDFGPAAFDGSERWLQLGVRVSGSGPTFTPLTPRQKIEASPYAAFALRSGLSGTYAEAVTLNNASNAISGSFTGSGAALSALNAANVSSGLLSNARTSANTANAANSIVLRNASGGFNAGAITATSFTGSGAGLTGLNASNLSTGTIADALLSGVYTNPVAFSHTSNAFVGAFSGSGASLTNLNAASVATGNLATARLPIGGGWSLSSNLTIDGTLAIDAATGNVGIGETSPARKLDLEGAANLAGGIGQMRIRDTANAVRSLEVGFSNTNTNAYLQTVKAAADTFFPRIALQPNGGSVGIGTTEPGNLLTVDGDANFTGDVGFGMALPSAPVHARSVNATTGIFDRASTDGTIISLRQDGGEHGTITVSGTLVSYNAFTGSHYGWCGRPIDRFALVRLTGDNRRLRHETDAEVIYGIEPTTHANDPACLGAFLGPQDGSQPVDDSNPLLVMAVGNGEMWVIDDGRGDIEPGDSLIASDVPGCAMKDDLRRFDTGYVIARAAQRVRWDDLPPPTDATTGVRKARVSVLFESFVRDSRGAIESRRVQADVARVLNENTSLRSEVAELRSLVEQLMSKEANR